ncbi:MAG: amidohydrolase family protein [Dehalococcoidia bacterium]|jgi:predicted TIM-barrel fold metal-dependent hydrolase|nr:amidohydrolase family protein [Dehalococcoidia bacterium]
MTSERAAWLAQTTEDPIDPDLPICDPHHHLWDRPDSRYMLDELLEDIGGGHRITETVFVECSSMYRKEGPENTRPVGETEFVNGIAAQSASGNYGDTKVAAGIVGYADLTLGDRVTEVLESHIETSRNRFRGIRQSSCWDESPDIGSYKNPPRGLLGDPKFRMGFSSLEKLGLSFDAWLFHTQLLELVDLARAFPNVPIILDHIAGPLGIGPYAGRREEVVQVWKKGITELATCPNVVIKLGGFGMPIGGFEWHERDTPATSKELAEVMAPYYNHCIESLGVNRCMFESNFPVDKVSVSYTVLWNTFKRIARDFSPAERAALFRDTAVRTYRLAPGQQA